MTSILIDNIFSNHNYILISNILLYNDISDHLPVFCIHKINKFNKVININDENEYYMSQQNISDYKQYLLDYNWDAFYLLNDPHDSFELFIKILENSKEKFRCKKKLNTKNVDKIKCWLVHGLIKCIIKKFKILCKLLCNFTNMLSI